eukprot:TRINITY_DN18455_c0_g1_i4.p1 TRINITY_DN18455_c0_g1~~TRINITY_DN18455_c0_g1_i4.p1  ORF type:complete len:995 (+),score=282.94 TRINITY_DN18455_c0_g1_i4:87-3071(+)
MADGRTASASPWEPPLVLPLPPPPSGLAKLPPLPPLKTPPSLPAAKNDAGLSAPVPLQPAALPALPEPTSSRSSKSNFSEETVASLHSHSADDLAEAGGFTDAEAAVALAIAAKTAAEVAETVVLAANTILEVPEETAVAAAAVPAAQEASGLEASTEGPPAAMEAEVVAAAPSTGPKAALASLLPKDWGKTRQQHRFVNKEEGTDDDLARRGLSRDNGMSCDGMSQSDGLEELPRAFKQASHGELSMHTEPADLSVTSCDLLEAALREQQQAMQGLFQDFMEKMDEARQAHFKHQADLLAGLGSFGHAAGPYSPIDSVHSGMPPRALENDSREEEATHLAEQLSVGGSPAKARRSPLVLRALGLRAEAAQKATCEDGVVKSPLVYPPMPERISEDAQAKGDTPLPCPIHGLASEPNGRESVVTKMTEASANVAGREHSRKSIFDMMYGSSKTGRLDTDDEEDNEEDQRPRRCSDHPAFKTLCSAVILLNAVFIGAHTEYKVRAVLSNQPEDRIFETLERVFAAFFLVELAIRVVNERSDFIFGEDWRWNAFDTFLVLHSVFDLIAELSASSMNMNSPNFSFVRVLRIFRFARILRLIRVIRIFHSFRLMVLSIVGSMLSLLWVFILLVVILYGFSIFFLYGVAATDLTSIDEEHRDALEELFGSVFASLLSLFMAISGGMDWGDILAPLSEVNFMLGFAFIMYIFFMFFGVLNVVVGTFVDTAFELSKKDQEHIVQEEMAKNEDYSRSIRDFFESADKDGSGNLSWDEFEKHLGDKRVKAYFNSLQLDVAQARALFLLLDVEETDQVDIEQFVHGCMRLKGEAKSIDVNMIMYENEKMMQKLAKFMDSCDRKFQGLENALGVIGTVIPNVSDEGAWQQEARQHRERMQSHLKGHRDEGKHAEEDVFDEVNKLFKGMQGQVTRAAQAASEVSAALRPPRQSEVPRSLQAARRSLFAARSLSGTKSKVSAFKARAGGGGGAGAGDDGDGSSQKDS